ncbi:MAG: hypothetical protein IKL28_07900 [Lachnospiraceae bacterium]|nr:hypothetical protein [Lachnospiraceae bacterium]
MNMAIAFFGGCMTFVLMMVVKVPIKKLNMAIAERFRDDEDEIELLYKRLNVSVMVAAMLLSMLCYYIVAAMLGITNLKWCCAMKGGAIAIALHAVYAQWFEVPQNE